MNCNEIYIIYPHLINISIPNTKIYVIKTQLKLDVKSFKNLYTSSNDIVFETPLKKCISML